MKLLCKISLCLVLAAPAARAASMAIDSLSGPITANEISAFKAYIATQTPAPTPWGALNGTSHNDWADGTSGNALEAMGLMYEATGDMAILNTMISWADKCTSERNDLLPAGSGGQRVMWTGTIAKVWVPNAPGSTTPTYAGGENGDTKAHLAYCALQILHTPSIWSATVPDGDPFGYGTTYLARAQNYITRCDEGHDDYDYIFYTGAHLIRNPSNWPAGFHTMEANNIQMMLLGYVQRLAECHEILGDNPTRVAQYDLIAKSALSECINGMAACHPTTVSGHSVYAWCYYPWDTYPSHLESVGHAAYDMVGVWRAYNRSSYGFTFSKVKPFADALVYVMSKGGNNFSTSVDGSGATQNYMQAQWLLLADWNPAAYDLVAAADLASGRYKTTTLMDATILWMKQRRYLQFSVTPAPASRVVQAGGGTTFALSIAPLGGFTNIVNLAFTGLPAGATGSLSSASINLAALNSISSNVTFSISTSNSTPPGAYLLNIVGASGGISHTSTVNLVVGNFSLSASPPSQTVSGGNSANYTVAVATNSGYNGSVSFGISGLPANAGAGFNPGSLNGAGNSALTVTTASNTPAGNYALTILGTNGSVVAATTVSLVVVAATNPVWTGGSSSGSYWNDAVNWGGAGLTPGSALVFNGTIRLNNTNDTAAATVYSNLVFNAGAGAFVLNGNPITLSGTLTNASSNPQTLNLGLNFNSSLILNGAGNPLVIAAGLTNRSGAPGSTTLTLAGAGQLVNLLNSTTSPGGTNAVLLNDAAANWTLTDNAVSIPMTAPWVFQVNNGTFNFGTVSSAPILTTTTINGAPSDNQVGTVSGGIGTFNMIAGTWTTSARLNTATAANSTGIINQNGGTLNVASQFQGANGSNPGEVSVVNVSGGTLNIAGGTGPLYVASRGAGSLSVGGSGVVNCGKLDISRNANGNAVSSAGGVNLDGGILMVTSVTNISANQQTNGSPTATFNFNGGTLVAKSGAATVFFRGSTVKPITPIATFVQAGGAIIDDGGNAITIAEPLQHDPELDDLDGGLTKLNTGALTLTAVSTYDGDTIINAGTLALNGAASIDASGVIRVSGGAVLDVSVHTGGTLTLVAGQTLTGSGTVKGNMIVGNGATFAPGGSLTTLVFNNNLTLNAGSTTVFEVRPAPAGAATNDVAQVAGNVVLGGTLMVTNVGTNAFSAGDSFKLFNAGGFSGSFTSIVPALPAVNLAWNTNTLASDGTLRVVSAPTSPPRFGSLAVAEGGLVFSGSNGVPNWIYYVLVSTNVSRPWSQWTPLATNTFDASGHFSFTNPVNPVDPQLFYLLQLQ